MSPAIDIEKYNDSHLFTLSLYNTNFTLCIHQLMTLLRNIYSTDSHLLNWGLLISTNNCSLGTLDNKPVYRLCFGRTFLLLSEQDVVEMMSQIWNFNPMLMHWVLSEEQVCS